MPLSPQQQGIAGLIYNQGLKAGLSPQRSMELVSAAYAESGLDPRARNKSSGAAGLFQLLSSGYVNKANEMGGVFDPMANIKAILPSYLTYWKRFPGAAPGAAGRDVERSGMDADFYSKSLGLFSELVNAGPNTNWVKNVGKFYAPQSAGDPDVTQETANYLAQANDLEKKFGSVDAQFAGVSDFEKNLVMGIVNSSMPGANDTPLRQVPGSSVKPIESTPYSGPANEIIRAKLTERLMERMGISAQKAGLGFEVDHTDPMSPNAAAMVDGAAQYVGEKNQAVVNQAQQFLGTPYKWGGESPQTGFDCSGFAQWLYEQQGISLPRTTYQQIKVGAKVGIDELGVGDLVFFGSKKDPHHEGIYIGNGQFIHAPHTGDVIKISSLREGYYRQNFVTGRRVTG